MSESRKFYHRGEFAAVVAFRSCSQRIAHGQPQSGERGADTHEAHGQSPVQGQETKRRAKPSKCRGRLVLNEGEQYLLLF